MNPFPLTFVATFAELLTVALMHFVWQGAVLSLMLLVTVKLFAVRTASRRYLLSVGTLLLMGVAPLATALWHHQLSSTRSQTAVVMSAVANPVQADQRLLIPPETDTRGVPASEAALVSPPYSGIEICVLIAWLVGVFVLSLRLVLGFGVTLWLRRTLQPLSAELEQRIRLLGDRLHVDTRQRVFACLKVGQAVAVGFIRPVVLIPTSWLTQLEPSMIEAVIAHELAHIRRWDLWVNLGQRVIETLLFYHPVIWWLSGRIRLEREMCCDEIAATCFDRAMYARSLESVAHLAQGRHLLVASIDGGKKMKLLNRIRYLLGGASADAGGNGWIVGLVAMLVALAGAIVLSLSAADKPSTAAVAPKEIETVVITRPQSKSVTISEQYVGQIQAHHHIEIRSLEQGYLEGIAIKEGQTVKQGDVMFSIRPLLHQAKLDAENADAKIAQLEYNYTKKLHEDKVVSADELALREAKLAKANARVRLATAELDFATLKAPFNGIVDRFRRQAGSLVLEGEVLTTLSDNSALSVYFNVPENRYLEYMADQDQQREEPQVELVLANGKKFDQVAKIKVVEADFNHQTGNILFCATFPNPQNLIRHGQRGTVVLNRIVKDAIVIPQSATFEALNKRFVYVVDNENIARQREVQIQQESEDIFVISSGVNTDDKIILDGIRRVGDGEKVEWVERHQKKE